MFEDERRRNPVNRKNKEGTEVLGAEVIAAIAHTKKNKAAGPDGIVAEMIEELEKDFETDTVTEIIDKFMTVARFQNI